MKRDDDLWAAVYDDLRRRAHRALSRERAGHTLDTTALVHEAYSKLAAQDSARFNDRSHFLAVAAMAMRRILVNHARDRVAQKRGGHQIRVTLEDPVSPSALGVSDLIAVDDLLDRLAQLNERQSQVVIYKFYGGLDDAEIAEALGVSAPTVRRDWRAARAWLVRELGDRESPP
jgi:RNA polymerase sigma factor (TIGR02999 family)